MDGGAYIIFYCIFLDLTKSSVKINVLKVMRTDMLGQLAVNTNTSRWQNSDPNSSWQNSGSSCGAASGDAYGRRDNIHGIGREGHGMSQPRDGYGTTIDDCVSRRDQSVLDKDFGCQADLRGVYSKDTDQELINPFFQRPGHSTPVNRWNRNSGDHEKERSPAGEWGNVRPTETEWGPSKSAGILSTFRTYICVS